MTKQVDHVALCQHNLSATNVLLSPRCVGFRLLDKVFKRLCLITYLAPTDTKHYRPTRWDVPKMASHYIFGPDPVCVKHSTYKTTRARKLFTFH